HRREEFGVIRAHRFEAKTMIPPRLVVITRFGAEGGHDTGEVVAALAPGVCLHRGESRLQAPSVDVRHRGTSSSESETPECCETLIIDGGAKPAAQANAPNLASRERAALR